MKSFSTSTTMKPSFLQPTPPLPLRMSWGMQGEWFMFLMLRSQRWYWEKNTSNEKDGAGAFQQPETCCGSCNDNILTTIKRLSKLLELALASVCQCSFSYLIMEWSESLVQLWTVMDSFSLDCLRCWGQDSRCSSMWARGLWWQPLVSSSATQPPHSLAALSR